MKAFIIGAGLIGKKRASSLPQVFELFGVYDLDIEKSKVFADLFSCRWFRTLDEGISSLPKGSLVIIAIQHSDLFKVANICLQTGLHVLVEKPGAISGNQMMELNNLADKNGATLSVGFNHRFHEAAMRLKKICEEGPYGEPLMVRARYGHGGRRGYETEWRANREISGGGELIDQGIHLIDLLHYYDLSPELKFAGLPTLFWNMEVEDNAFLAGRIKKNGYFWLHASWTEWKNLFSFEIFFASAKVEWSGLGGSYGAEKLLIYDMEKDLKIPVLKVYECKEEDKSWEIELLEVHKRILGKKSFATSGSEAVQNLNIVETAYLKYGNSKENKSDA